MMTRRIIVTGLYRSGTTLLYNAVRLLAVRAVGKHAVYGCYAGDYDILNRAAIHVVKASEFIPHLALGSEILYIYRPLEDVRASMARFAEFHPEPRRDTDAGRIDEYLRWLLHWTSSGARGIQYGSWSSTLVLMSTVCELVGLEGILSREELEAAAREFDALTPPETGSDPITLLHAHHITRTDDS